LNLKPIQLPTQLPGYTIKRNEYMKINTSRRSSVMRRWQEASKNLSPAYQALGDNLFRKKSLGFGQLDLLFEMLEESGLLLKALPAASERP
jgi:hypothetical protein